MLKFSLLLLLLCASFSHEPQKFAKQGAAENDIQQPSGEEPSSDSQQTQSGNPPALEILAPTKGLEARADESTNDSEQPTANDGGRWTPTEKLTGIIAVLTGLLAAAAIWQVCVSRKSAERQLRAYVSIDAVNIEFLRPSPENNIPESKIRILMNFMNMGQTPATNIVVTLVCDIFERGTYPSWGIDDPNAARDIFHEIGPKKSFGRMLVCPKRGDAHVSSVENDTHRLYLWGSVTYRDAFMYDRELPIRAVIKRISGRGWVLEPVPEQHHTQNQPSPPQPVASTESASVK